MKFINSFNQDFTEKMQHLTAKKELLFIALSWLLNTV